MLILTETERRGGRRPHREAPATSSPAQRFAGRAATTICRSRSPSGSPAASGRMLRDRRRSSATPTRRCTRRSRSGATRRTSSPSPTRTPGCRARRSRPPAGRAALEIGRQARDAATARLTSVHLAAAPLPRPAVGADRRDRRRRWPASSSCPRPRSTGSGRGAPPRRRQGRRAPRRSSRSRRRSSSAEWRTVVQHPRIGQVILEQAAALKDAVPIILHHHERYAGHGYPYGLRGNEIPLGARIVAIADAYDAMIHDRPYKRGDEPRRGDRRAAAPRRDAVRPRARRRCSATCTRTARAVSRTPTVLAMNQTTAGDRHAPTASPDPPSGAAAVRGRHGTPGSRRSRPPAPGRGGAIGLVAPAPADKSARRAPANRRRQRRPPLRLPARRPAGCRRATLPPTPAERPSGRVDPPVRAVMPRRGPVAARRLAHVRSPAGPSPPTRPRPPAMAVRPAAGTSARRDCRATQGRDRRVRPTEKENATVNKVLLTGRLTRDPEMRSLASGKAVTHVQRRHATSTSARQGEGRVPQHRHVGPPGPDVRRVPRQGPAGRRSRAGSRPGAGTTTAARGTGRPRSSRTTSRCSSGRRKKDYAAASRRRTGSRPRRPRYGDGGRGRRGPPRSPPRPSRSSTRRSSRRPDEPSTPARTAPPGPAAAPLPLPVQLRPQRQAADSACSFRRARRTTLRGSGRRSRGARPRASSTRRRAR